MKTNIIKKSQYRKQKKPLIRNIIEWIITFGITVIVALFMLGNIFSITLIEGVSMEPTLHNKDTVFNYKLGYLISEPKMGDVVILNKDESSNGIVYNTLNEGRDIIKNLFNRINNEKEVKYIIKRIMAVPGDVLDIKDGNVYINGNKLEENYIKGKTYELIETTYPITIGENQVFVLGDNRINSLDSRVLGLIDFEQVKGKAIFRIWPIDRIGKVK